MYDWRKILKAYLKLVSESEGIDFLDYTEEFDGLSKGELIALLELSLEGYDTPKYKNWFEERKALIEKIKSNGHST